MFQQVSTYLGTRVKNAKVDKTYYLYTEYFKISLRYRYALKMIIKLLTNDEFQKEPNRS